MTSDEEFAVFDLADGLEIADEDGNLYGMAPLIDGSFREIGTRDEQVAEFPAAREGEVWHGYPIWPLKGVGARCKPAKSVFDRMVVVGLVSAAQAKRLKKGDHI